MAFHNVPPNGFPDLPDVEELEAVQKDVQNLKTMKAAKADIAPEFSATSNYAVGDMVYHDGTLYKCTTVHEAAAWNADHFAAATIGAEISAVKGDVSDLEETKANQITIAPFFSAETAYEVGDIVYYNGLSYRCTNAHDGEWDAADFAATTVAGELSELNSNITTETTVTQLVGNSYLGVYRKGNTVHVYLRSSADYTPNDSAVIASDLPLPKGLLTIFSPITYWVGNSRQIGAVCINQAGQLKLLASDDSDLIHVNYLHGELVYLIN